MGKEVSWFKSIPKREQLRREKEYKNQMFPFGEAQKKWETDILQSLLETKLSPRDALYQLVCVKECLQLSAEDERNEDLLEWRKSPLAKGLTRRDAAILIALAELESKCMKFDEFPVYERILQEAAKVKVI